LFESEALSHLDSIYNSALYLTRNERDAEDLAQDTFLKAFRHFEQFQPGTNCRAWLFRIMVNTFLNRTRKSVRELSFIEEIETTEPSAATVRDGASHMLDPESGYLQQMFSETVREAIESLPADFRTAVVLADLQDFSYKEIAEIMNCPVGTVMSRIFRGRRLLQSRLRGYAAEHGIGNQESEPEVVSMSEFRQRQSAAAGRRQA
jgi:RNA polymerase sigma-70 factor (ECF subfamily)